MGFLAESVRTALALIFAADREVFATVWTSLSVAAWSVVFASALGIPLGMAVAVGQFRLKPAVMVLLNSLMATPTVVVGLVVYGMLSRQGPLGRWGLLFTPSAMVLGQTVLAVPIVANYTLSAIKGADSRIMPTALTLGAGPLGSLIQLTREVRFGIMAAVIAGFGRVIAEVGAAMMLGDISGVHQDNGHRHCFGNQQGRVCLWLGPGNYPDGSLVYRQHSLDGHAREQPPMNPLYHLTSIQKLYGTKVALDVPELTVPRGGLHVLTGPNGSGKSTLLNILALLTRPERGQMEFAGVAVELERNEGTRCLAQTGHAAPPA